MRFWGSVYAGGGEGAEGGWGAASWVREGYLLAIAAFCSCGVHSPASPDRLHIPQPFPDSEVWRCMRETVCHRTKVFLDH